MLGSTVCGDYLKTRHNGGVNVAYADGHAKWVQISTAVRNRNMWLPPEITTDPTLGNYGPGR